MVEFPSKYLVGSALVLLLATSGQAVAAVLTFDSALCEDPPIACANGLRINQAVGDVAGQLDVTYANRVAAGDAAEFATNLSGIRWFGAGYGDLSGVLWGRGDNGVAEVALRPAPGFQVTLSGFDLGAFSADIGTQYTVYDGNYSPLAASGPLVLDAFGTSGRIRYGYDFDLTSANGLIIQWGPDSGNVALDNLEFEVTPVPAPAAVVLLGTGLAGLVTWRSGRRRLATA